MIRIEVHIHMQQTVETLAQQARAYKQHNCNGKLKHHSDRFAQIIFILPRIF